VQGSDGNFYGTTVFAGFSDLGTIFRLEFPDTPVRIASFNGLNGSSPTSGVIQGKDGNFYGTSVEQVKTQIEAGRDVILEIDVQGAANVLAKIPEAVSIFILPPSYEVLAARLEARATEKSDHLELRLRNSFGEVGRYSEFKYVIVNNEVEKATLDLQTVILADRFKRDRQMNVIQSILSSFDEPKKSKN